MKGEVKPGSSLTGLLLGALKHRKLRQGDILVIKHKIVSKVEGQFVDLTKINPPPHLAAGHTAIASTLA